MGQVVKTGRSDPSSARLRRLPNEFETLDSAPGGLTGAQLGMVAKAALSDFVNGRTDCTAIREVTRLLSAAITIRQQEIKERETEFRRNGYTYF